VELFDGVLELMEAIKEQLFDAALNEEYKLPKTVDGVPDNAQLMTEVPGDVQ
jgi:hypothetical protein